MSQKLLETQEAFETLSNNPQPMIDKIQTIRETSSEYYSQVLLQEYSEVTEILATAIEADKSIAMTEA